jgi:hypothetical protein
MILQVADLLTTFLTCAVTSIRLGGAEIFTIASLVFGKCLNVIIIIIIIDRTEETLTHFILYIFFKL